MPHYSALQPSQVLRWKISSRPGNRRRPAEPIREATAEVAAAAGQGAVAEGEAEAVAAAEDVVAEAVAAVAAEEDVEVAERICFD